MSNYVPKNGEITVWKNDKYEIGGKYPYAKGKGLNLDGKQVEIALWIPKSEKIAEKAFNMTIKEVVEEQKPQTKVPTYLQQAPIVNPTADYINDLPF